MDVEQMIWLAAIETGYARDGQWIPWADAKIIQLDEPPLWLLQVCVQQTTEEAIRVLGPTSYEDRIRVRIGFMYLTYERDKTELLPLLSEACRLTEEHDDFRMECREFWTLEKEAAERPAFVPGYRPLADRVAKAFKPFSDLARRMWSKLHGE